MKNVETTYQGVYIHNKEERKKILCGIEFDFIKVNVMTKQYYDYNCQISSGCDSLSHQEEL